MDHEEAWPPAIGWIAKHLEPGTVQSFKETPMAAGSRRRPTSTPRPALRGKVSVDPDEWNLLLGAIGKQLRMDIKGSNRIVQLATTPKIISTQFESSGSGPMRETRTIEITLLLLGSTTAA